MKAKQKDDIRKAEQLAYEVYDRFTKYNEDSDEAYSDCIVTLFNDYKDRGYDLIFGAAKVLMEMRDNIERG